MVSRQATRDRCHGQTYFTEVDPWSWTPRGRISDHVQVDHRHHGDRCFGDDVAVRVRWVSGQYRADDEHHAGHPDSAADQTVLAAPEVDTDEQEDQGRHDLDRAVHTRREEGRVGLADANRLENLGRVVSDAVGTGELLPEHDAEGQEETVAVALAQRLFPGDALGGRQLLFQRGPDLGNFLLDHFAVGGLVSDVRQRLDCLLVPALLHEPPGRFREEEEPNQHEATRDELNRNGDPPLLGALGNMERNAVVQPEGKGAADHEEFLEQACHPTTDLRRTVLTDEHGRDTGHAADTQTGHHTAAVDHPDVVVCADLERRAEQKHDGEEHQRIPTPDAVVQDGSKDGTEEAACREERHHIGGDLGILAGGEPARVGGEAKVLLEALQSQDTAHHTRVIACKTGISSCQSGNKTEEAAHRRAGSPDRLPR